MREPAQSPQVAIVGAGPGGLASAMLLAREGVPVTVFERDPAVGGRTRTIHAPGGYKFDIGPTFQMLGLGYGHPKWAHGRHHGEALTVEREDFVPAELDPMLPHHLHIQALVGVTMTAPDGSVRRGKGVLEQLVLGPHTPSGFRDVLDPAQ